MLGAAIRVAYAIGLHRESTDLRPGEDEIGVRAVTFWYGSLASLGAI